MKSKKHMLGLLIIIMVSYGCATFKSDVAGKFSGPESKNLNAERVSVLFIFSHYRQTIGYDAIPRLDDDRERIRGFDDFFMDALNEFSNVKKYATFTNYASDVNEPERRAKRDSMMKEHDFVIKMKFMRTKSFTKNFLGTLVSSFSLTTIPVPYTYDYRVEAEIYDEADKLIETYTREASLTKWVQTLMIFLYPFHPEKRKREELYVDFMHDIFRQIESERVLRK